MNLTPRQMLILLVLIVGFGVAAYVVSRDETGGSRHDQATWCRGAEGLEGLGPLFRGEVADATVDDLDAAKDALFEIENIAPDAIHADIAKLADFALIAKLERAELEWAEAYVAARANADATGVDNAREAVATEVALCGLDFG